MSYRDEIKERPLMIQKLQNWHPRETAAFENILRDYLHVEKAEAHLRRAAVLIPLYEIEGRLHAVFIERTRHFLPDGREAPHSGQIAFPGGKQELGETLRQTALREAREETALNPQKTRVLGEMGTLLTYGSFFRTTVFLGWLENPPALIRDQREVAAIHHVPLCEIADQHAPHLDLERRIDLLNIHYHWQNKKTMQRICIWGMTGRVMWLLFELFKQIK